jgi:WD40 repeat protein/serine/threonine protein kinase
MRAVRNGIPRARCARGALPALSAADRISAEDGTPYKYGPGFSRGGPRGQLSYRTPSGRRRHGNGLPAHQEEPILREVAVKVIKLGMDTRQVIARFESERQALAVMDHPNIARVFEAGTTEQGRPYFAMEYVPGIPITQYCDENELNTRKRLELFLPVCQAVQHAHQKGIIHRDIKPANILVAIRDGRAVPTIIDFGLAKATEKRLTEETLFTQIGALIGTPEYMSPEQAEIGEHDIDSRTDIYSLGVVLYELLVGTVPFDSKALRQAGYDEIRRVIREEDPPKPTTRLGSLGGTAVDVARRRHTDVSSLTRQIRGDLEWITLKALEKEPARRYASASEFAADIMRHLGDEPVVAATQTTPYRVRKFIRKHRTGVAAAAAVVACLLATVVITTALYIRAERNRAIAARRSYVANIGAAALSLNASQPEDARRQLMRCDPKLRGWEWRHLLFRTDPSLALLTANSDLSPRAAFAFSPDGRWMFWEMGRTVEAWGTDTHQHVGSYRGFGQILALSRDGRRLLGSSRVFDVLSGQVVSTLDATAMIAAFSPNGTTLALGLPGGRVRLTETASGRPLLEIRAEHDAVSCLEFSPDGRNLATVSRDNVAKIWDVSTGKMKLRLRVTTGAPAERVAAFSPDSGRIALPCPARGVCIWDVLSGGLLSTIPATRGITAVVFSPDGARVAFVAGGSLHLSGSWNQSAVVAPSSEGRLNSVAFSPDGKRIYTGSMAGEVRIWNAVTYAGTILRRTSLVERAPPRTDILRLPPSPAPARQVPAWRFVNMVFHPDGRRVIASRQDKIEIWDAEDGETLASWKAHDGVVSSIAVSPDGSHIVSGSGDNTARIWDLTGALLLTLKGHTDWVSSVAFSPSGQRIATGSGDKTVRVWDVATGRVVASMALADPVNSVAFSPDGSRIVSGSGDERNYSLREPAVRVWQTDSGRALRSLTFTDKKPIAPVVAVSFSPDGGRIFSSRYEDGTVWVWDARSGRVVGILRGHPFHVPSLVFSRDGSRLFTGSWDRTVRVWDAETYDQLLVLTGHSGSVYSVAVSPNDCRVLSVSSEVRIWDTRSCYEPEAETRRNLGRSLR